MMMIGDTSGIELYDITAYYLPLTSIHTYLSTFKEVLYDTLYDTLYDIRWLTTPVNAS